MVNDTEEDINMEYLDSYPELTFFFEGDVLSDRTLFFVDNVISTEYTFKVCKDILGYDLVPLICAVDYTRFPVVSLMDAHGSYSIGYQNGRLTLHKIDV